MAKRAAKFDPRIRFENLSDAEQDAITHFLDRWSGGTPKERWALAQRYPKTVKWLAGQRPTDRRYRIFVEGGRVLTADQRVKVGLPGEVGPRFEGRRTEAEEVAAEERRAKRWSERDALRAVEQRAREVKEEAARAKRWRERDAARALEARARELAGEADRAKRWDEREARAWARRQAREIEGEVAREGRWRKRAERESLHRVSLEIQREALRAERWQARYGTPNQKRALARLRASGYATRTAVRIYDEGLWEAMERLDPGCTERVLESWVRFETPRWGARLLRGKKPWELTRADVAASKLSQEQLNRVAAWNRQIHQRLGGIGVKTQRAMPVGAMLRSITQLRKAVPKGRGFELTIPGPLPLRVPVPAVRAWRKAALGKLPGEREFRFGRLTREGLPLAERVYGKRKAAVKGRGRIPVAKAIGRAMPEVIGMAIQTGAIPAKSGLAEVYGAYALSQMAKSALVRAGVKGAVAGPLGIVIGLAGLFGGWRRARRARREYRAARERMRAAAAARLLVYQVGYVPRRAGVRYERRRRRGRARPFAALYGSRLGLATGTKTLPARI